jgi:ABC-2 type transport system permease protein
MRLYYEVARRAFQRQLAYRTANLAGLFTNAVFGYLRAAVILALYESRTDVAGYDLPTALSYTWTTQASLMIIALWGWYDIEETIRTGDVVSDLSKPFSYLGYWLARDLGRAAYFLLVRCLPLLVVAVIGFGIRLPDFPLGWLLWLFSLSLATVVSFACRFLVNATAFWTADARGIGTIVMGIVTLLSGFIVPLQWLPSPIAEISLVLPFAGMVQTPADIFVGKVSGAGLVEALGLQLFWATTLLALSQLVVVLATRRVIAQGG